jgi:hypothetical protein
MTHAAINSAITTPRQAAAEVTDKPTFSTADYRRNQQKIAQLMAQLNQIVLDKPQAVKRYIGRWSSIVARYTGYGQDHFGTRLGAVAWSEL